MGLRFGKSIRLGRFMRFNLSRSGIGASIGIGGLRIGTGPRGTRFTADLPGAGTSYVKEWGRGKKQATTAQSSQKALPPPPTPQPPQIMPPAIPAPGFLAAQHEKELVAGLKEQHAGRVDEALQHFLAASTEEASAAILAASILAEREGSEPEAIALLETVVQKDDEFPTSLMEKYLASAHLQINITPHVSAEVPIDGFAATLLLVELYQKQNRIEEAIGLLEEVEELAGAPALTLSLCELYASRNLWDGVLECAKTITVEDDITLETAILRGRAMQEKSLYEAAVSVFTEALRKKKNRNPKLLREAMYRRALSYQALGKKALANREFQKLYAEAPDFYDVAQRVAAS